MESLPGGMTGVTVYLDGILITGPSNEEHLATPKQVLQKFVTAGLRLRQDKCTFMAHSVVYLGHRISAEGQQPVADKVRALQEPPHPRNVTELKSFLGLLSYYSRFLPNLSTVLVPLYRSLRHNQKWCWTQAEMTAFTRAKQLLLSSQLLAHFDQGLPITLGCDASSSGIGAVLSHHMPDGSEKPIGFASRTLSKSEKGYSQIEKEAFACVFGVKRFHDYLHGHHFFILQTDHRPLLALFNEARAVSSQASAQIQ